MFHSVFASLLNGGVDSPSHWNVVVCVGLVVLVMQITLTFRLYRKTNQQVRILARLHRDYDRGGDGRGKPRSVPKDFTGSGTPMDWWAESSAPRLGCTDPAIIRALP